MKSLLQILALHLFIPLAVGAQELGIGGIPVSIGTDKAVVEKDFQPRYKLMSVGGENADLHLVVDRNSRFLSLGEIIFRDGRVHSAGRLVSNFENPADPVAVTLAIGKAVQSVYDTTKTPPKIKTTVIPLSGQEITLLEFVFPGRIIAVSTQHGGERGHVSISEVIRSETK